MVLSALPAMAGGGEDYTYIVAADPQLWWQKKENNTNWLHTISAVNKLRPDFLIVCGDMINLPNDPKRLNPEHSEKMADSYFEGVKMLDKKIPIYHVAGNHDVTRFPTKATLKWYEKKFDKPWYSFTHKDSLFIVIESNSLIMHKGIEDVYKDQLAWLEKLLAKSKKKKYAHRTVFMHHPLFVKSPEEEDAYHNLPKEIRRKLLDLFVDNNIEMIFSGHLHRNVYAKYKEMELITTASACYGARGIRIVKVKGDKVYDNFKKL